MKMNLTDSDVTSLCYECKGSGPDLLLIHGFASSMRVWDPLVAVLQAHYRCWTVDLAGCGGSRIAPDRAVTLDEHTAMLQTFVQEHGIQPYAIIGHSMGGMLTLKLALATPNLAEKLVLVCPTVTGRYFWGANYLMAVPVVQKILRWTRPVWDVLQSEATRPLLVTPPYLKPDVRERVRDDFRRTSWGMAMSAITGITGENLGPYLPQIQQPTLVIVGGRDDMVPPAEGRFAAKTLPHATLLDIRNAHHLPLDEAPDDSIPVIETFLKNS
jgi:pimeloyl-ACP methyl ester carboxylesterase